MGNRYWDRKGRRALPTRRPPVVRGHPGFSERSVPREGKDRTGAPVRRTALRAGGTRDEASSEEGHQEAGGCPHGGEQGPGDGVGEVVVAPRSVVDRVAAPARGPALQAAELGHEAPVVKEVHGPGVQARQEVAVEVALRLIDDAVADAVGGE